MVGPIHGGMDVDHVETAASGMRQLPTVYPLRPQLRAFAEGVASGLTFTEAAQRVGATDPRRDGSRWGRRPAVVAYIAELAAANREAIQKAADARVEGRWGAILMGEREVLARTAQLARFSLSDLLREDGSIDPAKVKKAPAGAITGYEATTTTLETGQVVDRIKVTVQPALAALQLLARRHEKEQEWALQSTTPDGLPGVRVQVLTVLAGDPHTARLLDQAAASIPARATVLPERTTTASPAEDDIR